MHKFLSKVETFQILIFFYQFNDLLNHDNKSAIHMDGKQYRQNIPINYHIIQIILYASRQQSLILLFSPICTILPHLILVKGINDSEKTKSKR